MRGALLIVALSSASPGLAQGVSPLELRPSAIEPPLELGSSKFALPVVEYRAPDGSWKRSNGIIVGHDIGANAAVGIGLFKMTPKYQDLSVQQTGKSRKVSLGFSLRF